MTGQHHQNPNFIAMGVTHIYCAGKMFKFFTPSENASMSHKEVNKNKRMKSEVLLAAVTVSTIFWDVMQCGLAESLPGLLFGPEDGISTFFQNISKLPPEYTMSNPRRQYSFENICGVMGK
jgi:hypothetical protein